MSSFTLKMIAIIAMLIDHIGLAIDNHTMRIIGRLAFPIFAFQLVIGYKYTKNLKKFIGRLLLFAIISEVPFFIFLRMNKLNQIGFTEFFLLENNIGKNAMFAGRENFNILFTMLFAIFAIIVFESKIDLFVVKKNKINLLFFWFVKLLIIVSLCLIADCLRFDYGALGVMLILLLHIAAKAPQRLPICMVTAIFAITNYFLNFKKVLGPYTSNEVLLLTLFTFLPAILMIRYNGKKGYSMKYFFYIFYSLHITIIILLKYFSVI